MTPVFQTRFGTDKELPPSSQGNCFPASFASLMDLPLDTAPDFEDGFDWFGPWDRWCQDNGWVWAWVTWGESLPANAAPAGQAIGSGPSPRGPWQHSIVTLDGLPAHDPAGSGVETVPYCTNYVVFSRDWEPEGQIMVPLVSLPEDRRIPHDTAPVTVI